MIAHIVGSAKNLKDDLPFYFTMLEVIRDNSAVIARDWISAANDRAIKNIVRDDSKIKWHDVHNENSDAIVRSDVVIIEATNYGFQEGFYTSQALASKKPVLLLTRNDTNSLLISGIEHKLLTTRQYTNKSELKNIVDTFLKDNIISTKDLRFNFFIDRQIYSYLRETSYETGKNKSEIIRELLEEEIDKKG